MATGNSSNRGQWGSNIGFILAAAGSAIGLGNIWRFPYVVGENGGGAFLIIYLFCILLLGLPVMLAELTIGRYSRRNPVGAFESVKPRSRWKIVGFLGVITGICILSYYSVVAGYTLGYIGKTLAGNQGSYQSFSSNPLPALSLFITFIVLTVLVVQGGIKNGIERCSKILMPVLFFLMIILIIRSITLDGAGKGLAFYLKPDFSKVTGDTFLAAMGQAFFSLSLGMGCMITYGSYLPEDSNLLLNGVSVAAFDTLIALMAGLLIFPALFAAGMDPEAGPSLVFEVLPKIFSLMPGGNIIGASFFLLLSIAALTSTISLLEVATAYFVDEKGWLRKKSVWFIALIVLLLGIPSALSQGIVPWLNNLPLFHIDFLSLMDWIFGNIMLAVGALFLAIFIAWIWKTNNAVNEIMKGCPKFKYVSPIFSILLKFFCPAVILVLIVFLIIN
jgi:NSS family neurotransmitter:Na+ symporter